MSIENNFAGAIGNISAGFDRQILGQASHINSLQQGTAGGVAGQAQTARDVVEAMKRDPAVAAQVLDRIRNDPEFAKLALAELQKDPSLVKDLPPQIQGALMQALGVK